MSFVTNRTTFELRPLGFPQPSEGIETAHAHLQYMTGPRSERFKALVNRGILDPFGKITDRYANISLPPLTVDELSPIKKELEKPFEIALDGKTMRVSMGEIFRAFSMNISQRRMEVYIHSTRLIGGYVSYLLFNKTSYAKRVFEKLEIADLYEESSFQKEERVPADIDVRMHLEKRVDSQFKIGRHDLENLRNLVTWQLAGWFVAEHKENGLHMGSIQSDIQAQAFTQLCTIDTSLLQMQLISFKENPIDWILSFHLPRNYVLTADDLYLPLDFLFDSIFDLPVSPESHRGKPLESFFHCILGFIDAENVTTIDDRGWLRYLSWVTKGHCCIYMSRDSDDVTLEAFLFSKINTDTIKKDVHSILDKWIEKHHSEDPLAALIYTLNMCMHLQGRLSEVEIQDILKKQLSKLSFKKEERFFLLIQRVVCQQNVHLKNLVNLLKVAAFQAYVQNDPQVEIRTEGFTRPVIHLQVGRSVIQLDIQIVNAINALKDIPADMLKELFFLICPPHTNYKTYNIECLTSMEIDLDALRDSAYDLVKCEHPFICYVGLRTLFSDPTLDPKVKKRLAEKHFVSILELAEDKEAIWQEFNTFIGDLPPLGAEFMEQWVETLFGYGRTSESIACELWEKLPPSPTTFGLIQRLACQQPSYALRLFAKMDLDEFPNEAFECTINCGQLLMGLSDLTFEHDQLATYLASKVSHLFTNQSPDANLNQTLQWYLQRYGDQIQEKRALQHHMLRADLSEAFRTHSPLVEEETLEMVKEGIAKRVFTKNEQLECMLKFYHAFPDCHDPILFKTLIYLDLSSIPDKEMEFISSIVIKNMQSKPYKETKKNIGQILKILSYLKDSIPHYLYHDFCNYCYQNKIKLPKSMSQLWFKALRAECEKAPADYLMIYHLNLYAQEQNFNYDETGYEVLFQLAEHLPDHRLNVMQTLVSFLPTRIEKERFYHILAQLIVQNLPESFGLLDKISRKDPQPRFDLILNQILEQFQDLRKTKETYLELLTWLSQTKFFTALKNREIFQFELKYFLEKGINFGLADMENGKEWVNKLYLFVKHHVYDFKGVDSEIWDMFFQLVKTKQEGFLFKFYQLISQFQLLAEDDPTFFGLYLIVLHIAAEKPDPKSINYLLKGNQHHRLCASSKYEELILSAHYYYLSIAAKHSSYTENLLENIQEAYDSAKKNKEKAIIFEEEPMILEFFIDFNMIKILCNARKFNKVKELLRKLLDQNYPLKYWQQSDLIINNLTSTQEKTLLDELHEIAKKLDLSTIYRINIQEFVSFLMSEKEKDYYITASTLLRICISNNKLKPSKEIWSQIYKIMHGLLEGNANKKALAEAGCLATFVNAQMGSFEEVMGKFFPMQALEIVLLYLLNYSDLKDENFVPSFREYLQAAILCLQPPEMESKEQNQKFIKEQNRKLIKIIPLGIIKMSFLDEKVFADLLQTYMFKIGVATASNRQQCKAQRDYLFLPASECFAIKERLIMMMIEALKPDHPFVKQLSEQIKQHLTLLLCENAFKEKMEAFSLLFKNYHKALVSLSHTQWEYFCAEIEDYMKNKATQDSTNECFAIRERLITMMIEILKPNHPFAEQLSGKIREYITLLMRDFGDKKFDSLLTLYRNAQKNLKK